MALRRWLVVFPAVVLLACSGGSISSSDSDGSAGPSGAAVAEASAAAFDPDTADLRNLIYWDEPPFFGVEPPQPAVQGLFQTLLDSELPAAVPYLIDLSSTPTPYARAVVDALIDRFDRPDAVSVFDFPELFRVQSASEDSSGYLEFKQKLYSILTPEFGEFLDPKKDRIIAAREIFWGGVGVDGIPPLELPAVVTPDASPWLNADDPVIGVEINGDARAYPIRIIGWHEMVNDIVGGVPVSLAFCTLCGSAIVYDGRVRETVYRFGTSGLLYRSNKLMWDRTTGTLWEQFTGEPAWGSLVGSGVRLTPVPSVTTTWSEWLAAHPNTAVLDIDTGHSRDYSPGAANREYNASPELTFAVPLRDDRLGEKDEVVVVQLDGAVAGYPVDRLAKARLINDRVADTSILVLSTASGAGGRAYQRDDVEFISVDFTDATVTDTEGSVWRIEEAALVGPDGARLPRLNGVSNAFWFAVVNHTPDARLYEGSD